MIDINKYVNPYKGTSHLGEIHMSKFEKMQRELDNDFTEDAMRYLGIWSHPNRQKIADYCWAMEGPTSLHNDVYVSVWEALVEVADLIVVKKDRELIFDDLELFHKYYINQTQSVFTYLGLVSSGEDLFMLQWEGSLIDSVMATSLAMGFTFSPRDT